ncbi:MAG: site-specific DNA-methyltransferase [Gudongella sp.]|nr:site-specific DNA-methyltransferase [Gudongella sp.]
MHKKKAGRNKTIDFDIEQGRQYLDKCIQVDTPVKLTEILNKTIIGDSVKTAENIPNKSIDLIIVDPPYNLNKSFHGNNFSKKNDEVYEEYTRIWLDKVIPLLKDDGSIYVCCDWQSSLIIGKVLSERLIIRNRITWQREKGRGAKANWKNSHEDIWFATVSDKYTFNLDDVMVRKKVLAPYRVDGKPKDWVESDDGNFRDTCPSNFWDDVTVPFWSMVENTSHPTQKPEKLIAKLILASSNKGDTVLDPFLGSGTTSVTAKKLGRNYIGIEQNPVYCAWAEKRIEMADEDDSIQGFHDGVFWERNTLEHQKKLKKTRKKGR